ncbi:MAG: hypothetical protein IKW37_04195, partial [Bacteroidaceae bacterium]|nr:hypothetical protein [Bacteroidaceae bacterium]
MMKKYILPLLFGGLMGMSSCQPPANNDSIQAFPSMKEMQRPFGKQDYQSFVNPNKVHYPETWFHYIGGNVSHEGITADLEAIASAGISGVQLFHGQFGGQWPATTDDIQCLSENWDAAVRHTAEECKRLGLRFSMQNCPGWAMSGGPWIKPENAMRTIVYSRTDITGKDIQASLPVPQPNKEEWRDYRDITVLAFPTPEGDTGKPLELKEVIGNGKYAWKDLMTGKKNNINFLPVKASEEPNWVEVKFTQPTTLRSIELPCIQGMNHGMSFEPNVHVNAYAILADGTQKQIIDAEMPQASWQDHHPITLACPEVPNAIGCRLEFQNDYHMNLTPIKFWSAAHKNSWQSEAAWDLRSFERSADDIMQSPNAYLTSEEIIDITQHMTSDGKLAWNAPKEEAWTILRIGHVNEGRKNAPAPPAGTGWECDKLSTEGPEAHFSGYIGRLTDGALQGGMLNGMLLDSWECYSQTWTLKMEQEFNERKGYALRSWIPAIFGYVIDNPETTSRFLRDWRSVVGDLFANKFYRRMAELGHEQGLTVVYETAGGDVFPADIMEYFKHADFPMCEFWHPYSTGYVGSLNFKPIKPTTSAARLYGKPRVAAESFTSFDLHWNEHFEFLKDYADYHFIEGVTHNVFHTYTHNPQINFLPPGTSMGSKIGTPFLRGQTWWPYMKEFTTYLARCSYLLERGQSVSDVLWYLGDEISHKPDQEYPFPAGYKYDYCNPDVLLNRLSVKDGKVVTPEGLSYKFIWIPENKRMLPETLERLYKLLEEGATIVANAPKSLATLVGGDEAQQRFDNAVKSIWGNAIDGNITNIGKGRLLTNVSIEKAIELLDIKQDVQGNVRWLHRHVKGADWYFITPEKQQSFQGKVKFLAQGGAEMWDPITGEITPLNVEQEGEYASVELDLPKAGSCFVVFNHNKEQKNTEKVVLDNMQSIDNKWTLQFPEGWGAPAELEMETL